jgi:hypothetical protein
MSDCHLQSRADRETAARHSIGGQISGASAAEPYPTACLQARTRPRLATDPGHVVRSGRVSRGQQLERSRVDVEHPATRATLEFTPGFRTRCTYGCAGTSSSHV